MLGHLKQLLPTYGIRSPKVRVLKQTYVMGQKKKKNCRKLLGDQAWWLTSVIPAIQEAEIRKFKASPGQKNLAKPHLNKEARYDRAHQ
jgi:hypothetical protein